MKKQSLEAKVFGSAYGGGKTAALEKMKAEAEAQGKSVAVETRTGKTIKVDLKLATRSCKRCHGTGIMGTKLHPDGRRERMVCSCVAKAMVNAGLV